MLTITALPTKTIYEGNYYGSNFELQLFPGDQQEIVWLDFPPENIEEAEKRINKLCSPKKGGNFY